MENKGNKYIAVAYKLYTIDNDGTTTLVEEATDERPFPFISGFGITLDAFESALAGLAKGEEFDLNLTKEQAYGDFAEERVLNLDKGMFCINGRFDSDNIYKDAIIELQNESGQRFPARVLEIGADKVKMDLNHPLAGKTLNFKGAVLASREATNEEIQSLMSHLSDEGGCGGGCEGCGGGCGGHDHEGCGGGHHEGGCGHHHDGGCCGHH